MKKILSIVLAVLMLASCATMAFGATIITQETAEPKKADVTVQTTLIGSDMLPEGKYEITIPADTSIVWGSSNAAVMDYTVKSQLALGAKLSVKVVASSDKLVCAADTTKTLAYESTGLDEVKEYGEINNNVVVPVTITVPDWTNVPVTDYATTLTYTVTYTAPSTNP